MKIILFTTLSLFILFSSCKKKEKDSVTNNPTSTNTNSFTLKKDGVPYTAGKINISDTTPYIGIQAHISPTQVNMETYSMSLDKYIQPGIYDEENSPISLSSICAFIHIYNAQQVFLMDDGEINILSNDTVNKTIEFNFKFTLNEDLGTGIVQITDGHCKVHY
jgi:hypothetical protein